MRAALCLLLLFLTASVDGQCATPQQSTDEATRTKGTPQYSPRSLFRNCFLRFYGPDDKSRYESTATASVREAFLYQYLIVAADAAESDSGRKTEYYGYGIDAATAYIELVGTESSAFSAVRVRDVLNRMGEAYFKRRDVYPNGMRDLLYQFESIVTTKGFGARCFDRRSAAHWEKAIRCLSGDCEARDEDLATKISSERRDSTEFVQRCTSYAEFLTRAMEQSHLVVLRPRKQAFDRYLQVNA